MFPSGNTDECDEGRGFEMVDGGQCQEIPTAGFNAFSPARGAFELILRSGNTDEGTPAAQQASTLSAPRRFELILEKKKKIFFFFFFCNALLINIIIQY